MKRAERDMTPTSAARAAFIDLCIDIGASDKKSILKQILRQKYENASASRGAAPGAQGGKADELPSTVEELLCVDPSSAQFVDYAYLLCSFESQMCKRDVIKATLEQALDSLLCSTPQPRPKKAKARKLPPKLSPFVVYAGTEAEETLRAMDPIIEEFFPYMDSVLPCVYANESRSTFVLFVPDKNATRWKAVGSQCSFVWKISDEDVSNEVFSRVVNALPNVHVVRERKRELVYMGTCTQVDNVSTSGSCTMFVG